MSKHGTIRRYSLIIEKTGSGLYPDFRTLKEYLQDHGFEISDRTLQRDIEQIRVEFGTEILYDRSRNGYFIDRERSIRTESFLRFLEIVTTAELLVESLKDSKEALDHLSFEAQGSLKGIENLRSLLFAVRHQRIIRFSHENFQTGEVHRFSIKPVLLKEYQNRWYVIGLVIDQGDQQLTFGIDRISDLEITNSTFPRSPGLDPERPFRNIIGLTYSDEEPVEIVLAFTPLQGKYVKALPMHPSQHILSDTDEALRLRLKLVPNYEFRQQILKMGDAVQVLEPPALVTEIREVLENALSRYR